MSDFNDLLQAYQAVESLSQEILTCLKSGLDMSSLTPLFARKAVLGQSIQPSRLNTLTPEERQQLASVQQRATQTEAALAAALQSIVSSFETKSAFGSGGRSVQSGGKIDQTG